MSASANASLRPSYPERSGYGSIPTADTRFSVEGLTEKGHVENGALTVEGGRPCVTFHDVSYEISSCRGEGKVILNSVSGLLPCGLNAIMGPTGSGKSTMLDILADRKLRRGLTGTVLVNGERQPRNFKCISGYVVQDDVVMGTLSVRENLQFSAALRLPSHMNGKQRKERVEKVIEDLGLTGCADTKIGTEFFRGVSGGERKRTNIGMELIIEPQVLFLDEPTTGLDAHTAVSVVQLLKHLSDTEDRIVIMSIHQPRYSIFKLMDTLTLLCRGSMVYHGPAMSAMEYFSEIGFACEAHENPADYFLDVIIDCDDSLAVLENPGTAVGNSREVNPTTTVDLSECYRNSNQFNSIQAEIQPILDNLLEKEGATGRIFNGRKSASYATSFPWQLLIVSARSAINLLRNPQTSVFQLLTMIIFALIVGIIYLRINDRETSLQNVGFDRVGAMFFIVMNQVFGNLSAVDLFIRQKALFIHENVSGFYRVSAFFLAKVLADLLPMRFFPLCVFTVIVYFMVGFQQSVSKFFIFFLTLCLTSVAAASLAFAISSRMKVTALANLLIALCFVLSMLFGGFLVSLGSLPVWVGWLKYLSIFRYAVEALSINELHGLYCVETGANTSSCSAIPCSPDNGSCFIGTEFLHSRGYETEYIWLWYDQIALFAISVVLLSLTYIGLRSVKKQK